MGKHSKEPEKKKKKLNKNKTDKKAEKKKNSKKKSDKEYIKVEVQEKKSKTKKSKKTKKPRRLMKFVLTVLVLGTLSLGCFVGYKAQTLGGGITGFLATILGESEESIENMEPINIVVMGVSGTEKYKLSDTIMIASYNPKTQKASLMSIPRDTYVGKKDRKTAAKSYLESYKINAVYRNGTNIPEAMNRISAIVGMDLENYIIIDTKALIKLVDAIGGIEFDVPIDMNYDDDSQNLHIHLSAGLQKIDGKKAEQLLRFRHNNNGTTYPNDYGQQDLGRMRTQREFVTATLKQTMKPQNIFKLKQIIDILHQDVQTNLEVNTLKKYLPFAVEFNSEELKTDVLPGAPEYCNGVSIFVPSTKETKNKVLQLFGEEGTQSIPIEEDKTAPSNKTKQ